MTSPLTPESVAQMVADLTTEAQAARQAYDADLFASFTTEATPKLDDYDIFMGVLAVEAVRDMLTTLAADNATLRASEAAALERIAELENLTWEFLAPAVAFPKDWRGCMTMKTQGVWANGFQTCREQIAELLDYTPPTHPTRNRSHEQSTTRPSLIYQRIGRGRHPRRIGAVSTRAME